MKNKALRFFLILFSCFLFVTLSLSEDRHVFDNGSMLSAEQQNELEQRAIKLFSDKNIDFVFVSTNDSLSKTAHLYAADFYESVRPNGFAKNNVCFAFCLDTRRYGEAVSVGMLKDRMTSAGDEALQKMLNPYLKSKDYAGAMNRYIDYIYSVSSDSYLFDQALKLMPVVLIAAVIISAFIVSKLLSQLKISKHKSGAGDYKVISSLNLTQNSDIYLYTTTTKTKIQSSSSSGGSHTSSSGRSYGGRSGSF